MRLKVEKVVKETQDAVSLYFKNPTLFRKIKYKSGQFLTLNLKINNKTEKRAYSFSSSPYVDKDLRITIKKVEKGIVSNYIYDHVKAGDTIKIESPRGSFFHEPDEKESRTIVLFGAGSGVTPVLSIAKTVLEKEPNSNVLFFYANRDVKSIIFKEEIELLSQKYASKLNVIHILENENEKLEQSYKGYLQQQIVNEVFAKYKVNTKSCLLYTSPSPRDA